MWPLDANALIVALAVLGFVVALWMIQRIGNFDDPDARAERRSDRFR
jgi:hypothetical protein